MQRNVLPEILRGSCEIQTTLLQSSAVIFRVILNAHRIVVHPINEISSDCEFDVQRIRYMSLHGLLRRIDSACVQKLYFNVLNRKADESGQTYWVGQLNKGASRESVIQDTPRVRKASCCRPMRVRLAYPFRNGSGLGTCDATILPRDQGLTSGRRINA